MPCAPYRRTSAPLGQLAVQRVRRRGRRQAGEEGGVEDRDLGQARERRPGAADALDRRRVVQRRQRRELLDPASTASSTRWAPVSRGPPWTTRWPTATRSRPADPGPAERVVDGRQRGPVVVAVERPRRVAVGVGVGQPRRAAADPLDDAPAPAPRPRRGRRPGTSATTEPALRTSTCPAIAASLVGAAPHGSAGQAAIASGRGAGSGTQSAGRGTARTLPAQGRDQRDQRGEHAEHRDRGRPPSAAEQDAGRAPAPAASRDIETNCMVGLHPALQLGRA